MARRLGGRRVPVSGRQRGDVPDIAHPDLAIEHKYGKVISVRTQTALEQADAAAAKTGGIPVVTFEHVTAGVTNPNLLGVTMKLEVFQDLARKAGIDIDESAYS